MERRHFYCYKVLLAVLASMLLILSHVLTGRVLLDPLCSSIREAASSLEQNANLRSVNNGRSGRFPSVEQRIKLYMGAWADKSLMAAHYRWNEDRTVLQLHEPPPQSSAKALTLTSGSALRQDELLFLDKTRLERCLQQKEFDGPVNLHTYCRDVLESLPVNCTSSSVPLLAHFGDKWNVSGLRLPHFGKYRPAFSQVEWQGIVDDRTFLPLYLHYYPILWKFNTKRHFGQLQKVSDYDIPWVQKGNRATFWGSATGLNDWQDLGDGRDSMSEYDKCVAIPRCRLVYQSANSSLIVAKLTKTRAGLPETIQGVELVGPRIKLDVYLRHKAVIILEGNDVASALKWALYSNSVVMMPRPTFTSWAMEEFLKPWVHYVPIDSDLSNVEERMQWIIDHDEEAYDIAQNGRLWIHDLLYHEQAARDNARINDEIIRRYRDRFREMGEL